MDNDNKRKKNQKKKKKKQQDCVKKSKLKTKIQINGLNKSKNWLIKIKNNK